MKRSYPVLFVSAMLMAAYSMSARAEPISMQVEGYYKSYGITLTAFVLDWEEGTVAATTTVVMAPCSGTIAGIGHMDGHTLKLSPYNQARDGQQCVLTLVFDKEFKHVKIDSDNCSYYHGTGCGWEGQELQHRNR